MDGPDLSHLLDGTDSGAPSPAVLEGIVLRHKRLRVRRARTVATLGIVVAVASAGVGIGLSRKGGTTSALPTFGTGGSGGAKVPSSLGRAPAGLGWIATGSKTNNFSGAQPPVQATGTDSGLAPSGQLKATGRHRTSNRTLCTVMNCPTSLPFGPAISSVVIRHIFTRTTDGVTVRAFTSLWAAAPLELVPVVTDSGGTTSGHSSPPETRPGPTTVPTTVLPSSCSVTRALIVEVSDAGAVGVVTVPLGPAAAQPVNVLADQVVGGAEDSPMAIVVAHVTRSTTAVGATFAAGGRDEMTVVDGWAVLAHRLPAGTSRTAPNSGEAAAAGEATVYALASNGTVIERTVLPGSGALAMAVQACAVSGKAVSSPGFRSGGSSGSGSGHSASKPNGS